MAIDDIAVLRHKAGEIVIAVNKFLHTVHQLQDAFQNNLPVRDPFQRPDLSEPVRGRESEFDSINHNCLQTIIRE